MQINPAAVEASGWGWRHATRKDFALRAVDFTPSGQVNVFCCSVLRARAKHDDGRSRRRTWRR